VAQLAPTLIQKTFLEVPAELWVGLLVRPPNPDGDGYRELECENYARVLTKLVSASSQFHANAEEVSFQFEEGVSVTHIGLFDADGRLRFYGYLSGYRQGTTPPTQVRLGSLQMKVRKAPVYYGSGRSHIGGAPLA
jgi:hypothetical protein